MRILLIIVVLAIVVVGCLWIFNSPPTVKAAPEPTVVGRATPVKVTLDDRSGLKNVRIWWEQNGQSIPVQQSGLSGKHQEIDLLLGPGRQQGLKDGKAQLHLEARDSGFISKKHDLTWQVEIHSRPPTLGLISGQIYINQGGCELVSYSAGDTAIWSGVRVGQHAYPGYPMPGAPKGTYFAIFAFPYNESPNTVPQVVARDAAGNEAIQTFWYKLFPKAWHRSNIPVDDQFFQKVIPPILAHTNDIQETGDLLKDFLEVNGKLRKIDNQMIADIGHKSEPRFYWNGPFLNANIKVEASFADHRTYFYKGKPVDEQDHLGFDLASTQQAPVLAGNRGKVVHADYLGIYGNCIIIDHGYGLQSLYGHLAQFEVKVGDIVNKGQEIGRTDSTGLAAGDHLHFSMTLNGDQVLPTEWWDEHWIHDRILAKFPGGQLPQ